MGRTSTALQLQVLLQQPDLCWVEGYSNHIHLLFADQAIPIGSQKAMVEGVGRPVSDRNSRCVALAIFVYAGQRSWLLIRRAAGETSV